MEWVKISDDDKRKRWTSCKIIATIILVTAIIATNTVYFRSYTKTEDSGNKWAGIREAFNNETFSTINVTLGLPIITIILNEVFEVDTAIAEKAESIKENRTFKRFENIEKYNELNPEKAIKKEEIPEKIRNRLLK